MQGGGAAARIATTDPTAGTATATAARAPNRAIPATAATAGTASSPTTAGAATQGAAMTTAETAMPGRGNGSRMVVIDDRGRGRDRDVDSAMWCGCAISGDPVARDGRRVPAGARQEEPAVRPAGAGARALPHFDRPDFWGLRLGDGRYRYDDGYLVRFGPTGGSAATCRCSAARWRSAAPGRLLPAGRAAGLLRELLRARAVQILPLRRQRDLPGGPRNRGDHLDRRAADRRRFRGRPADAGRLRRLQRAVSIARSTTTRPMPRTVTATATCTRSIPKPGWSPPRSNCSRHERARDDRDCERPGAGDAAGRLRCSAPEDEAGEKRDPSSETLAAMVCAGGRPVGRLGDAQGRRAFGNVRRRRRLYPARAARRGVREPRRGRRDAALARAARRRWSPCCATTSCPAT